MAGSTGQRNANRLHCEPERWIAWHRWDDQDSPQRRRPSCGHDGKQTRRNPFILTVKSWVEKLNAIAIQQMKILVNDTMTIVDLSCDGIRQSKVNMKRRGDKLKGINGQ